MPPDVPAVVPRDLPTLPDLTVQADRLLHLGLLTDAAAPAPDALRSAAVRLAQNAPPGSLLVVHPRHLPPSTLAGHLVRTVRTRGGEVERRGFVVEDFTDVDRLEVPSHVHLPAADVYAVADLDRGDHLTNASPDEAESALAVAGRSPLTLVEGMQWVLQAPDVLQPGHCFMTIGSRPRKPDGTFDARTPALWISRGTGRDGAGRRGAAKVGWCWWRNRHTWLGFASATRRTDV
ncbi:DUF5701 family protein [Isoptericola jiangsuensis]|uniref:DUF5701 family protein n=1 Tax=Isoptericola jiangsuensis TaxID=548579 RepID=UPI003AB0D222